MTTFPIAPALTGHARTDGLNALLFTITHDLTPLDPEAVALALHVSPLAYLGEVPGVSVTAVNRAVDLLAASKRRHQAERDERRAKLEALFAEPEPGSHNGNGGSRVPVAPGPPAPPTPTAKSMDEIAEELSARTGLTIEAARKLLVRKAAELAGKGATA